MICSIKINKFRTGLLNFFFFLYAEEASLLRRVCVRVLHGRARAPLSMQMRVRLFMHCPAGPLQLSVQRVRVKYEKINK